MRVRSLRIIVCALVAAAVSSSSFAQQYRQARPDAESGPTRVELSMVVIDMFSIDDVDENFTMDFVIRATWLDPRLSWEAEAGVEALVYDLDEIWNPRLLLVNGQDLSLVGAETVEVDPDGTVRHTRRLRGTLSTVMNLRRFPFDSQNLPVRIIATAHSPEEVVFEVDESFTVMLDQAALSGWSLSMGEARLETTEVAPTDLTFPGVVFMVRARRAVDYFILTVAVPLLLITLMAWTVFWIDPSYLPSQVGISTASVFSMIAYRTALRLSLPKVSYMTRADVFILGATLLVFMALAHSVGTGRMAKSGREVLARRLDAWARWVYLLLLALLIVIALNW